MKFQLECEMKLPKVLFVHFRGDLNRYIRPYTLKQAIAKGRAISRQVKGLVIAQ